MSKNIIYPVYIQLFKNITKLYTGMWLSDVETQSSHFLFMINPLGRKETASQTNIEYFHLKTMLKIFVTD